MSHTQRKLPSDRTIAFAAAIVSSKPNDLTVREYIALLKRHVAKGRRENALSVAYRHLDRSAYWRAECERAKADYRAAEWARIDALREVDSLKAKLEFSKAATGSGGAAKRKRGNADVVPYSREVKKGRGDAEERREVFLGGLVIEEVGAGEGDVGCDALMRLLYQIGLCFKPGVHVEANALARHLVSAAGEISNVVLEALNQPNDPSSASGNGLSTTMTAAGRVVAGIMAGLQKLHRTNTGASVTDQVTYAIVHMYERLTTSLDIVSEREAKLEGTLDPRTDSTSLPTKPKTKGKGGPPRVNIKDVPTLNALTGLLSGIVKQLDAKQASHPKIFEGLLFCILSKLGKSVYILVFTHPRGASISEEINTDALPDDTNQIDYPIPTRQAQLQAPYLIHLLKQFLALTPSFTNPSVTTSKPTKSKPVPKPGSVTKTSLTLAAKERLQATLVNAIFGTEGLDDENNLLLSGLSMPAAVAGTLSVPRVKEAEVGQWFQGEVWRLLGWEVLGKELDGNGRG